MRIGLVAHDFAPVSGGASRYGWTVAEGLAARGHDVRVLCCEARSEGAVRRVEESERERVAGTGRIRVESVPCPHRRAASRVPIFARRAAARLDPGSGEVAFAITRVPVPDVLRVGWLPYEATLRDRVERSRVPLARAWHRWRPKTRVQLRMDRSLLQRPPRRVLFNAAHVRDLCVREFGLDVARTLLVRNGVDLERFHPGLAASLREEAREGFGLPRDGLVFLHVGPGFGQKGLDGVLRAMARFCGAGDVRLLAVGRDPGRRFVRRAARLGLAERVRFVTPIGAIERGYAAADAMLLPTRPEPFSNAGLEAMAAGLPLVTSRGNGAAEIVDASSGRVVSGPDDVEGLLAAMRELVDPELRSRLGRGARAVAERFPWSAHLDRLESILEEARA